MTQIKYKQFAIRFDASVAINNHAPNMPSYARKKIRRSRIASDIEEDEGVSINGDAEDDEQELEGVKASATVTKKEKGKAVAKHRQVADGQSDGQVEDEDTENESDDDNVKIDVANFKDQPLSRVEMPKVKGLATDWEDMAKKIQQSWAGVRQVAVAIAESAEDEKCQKVCPVVNNLVMD